MYLSFFGLNEKPFAITPDPRYLFMSERHGEGLAHLVYGVTESGGFIQLTGEVGTGKTTLVRTLLGQLPNEVDVALVLNPQLTAVEFLLSICEELGVAPLPDTTSSKALVDALNRHLLDTHARGRRTILLVDEAQNLAEDVLEQVRLLTNLETARQKLLQIILIGQPELRDLLAQNNLRQLAQRVTGRYHLEPLSRDETGQYIEHRLRVAGALTPIFEPAAKRAVYKLSGGIPRLINVICDRALLGAYSEESRSVSGRIVRRAASEVSGAGRQRGRRWMTAAGIALAVVAAAGAGTLLRAPSPAIPAMDPAPLATAEPDEETATGATLALAEVDEPPPISEPPAAATAAPDAPQAALSELLQQHASTLEAGMSELFNLWGIEFRRGAGTACEQAQAQGMSCLFQRGSWNLVELFDRPAVLTLVDDDGTRHYPVVTGVDGEQVRLALGDARVVVPLEELNTLWFGQYVLLWRPPNGSIEALRPGSRGANVRWLRDSLAELDPASAASDGSDVFDAELEAQLRDFQRRHRLQVDGLAGQQTQLLINSLLASENTPRLTQAPQ